MPAFSVSRNTEADCNGAGELSEKRWNDAFWRQNEVPVLEADREIEATGQANPNGEAGRFFAAMKKLGLIAP